MDETIMMFRCCMCPQRESSSDQCPSGNPCRFVRTFQDERGWTYFVRSGIGANTFKVFFQKPGKSPHGCMMFNWKDSFDAAQEDLNYEAQQRHWKETTGMRFPSN